MGSTVPSSTSSTTQKINRYIQNCYAPFKEGLTKFKAQSPRTRIKMILSNTTASSSIKTSRISFATLFSPSQLNKCNSRNTTSDLNKYLFFIRFFISPWIFLPYPTFSLLAPCMCPDKTILQFSDINSFFYNPGGAWQKIH